MLPFPMFAPHLSQSAFLPNLRELPTPPQLPLVPPRSTAILAASRKTTTLYFQHVAHSSQLAVACIPSTCNSLCTLCQKHPGVGVSHTLETRASRLNPIESQSFANVPSNFFRMILFRKTRGWGVR